MKRFKSIFISVLVIICCTQFCTQFLSADYKILAVPRYAQQATHWCWAAAAEMIMKYLGRNVPQCVQVNNKYGKTNCCCCFQSCALGGWPEYGKYGFTYSHTAWDTALSWAQLRAQIDNNKPVGFAWRWSDGRSNFMVARGYYYSPLGYRYVLINDPMPTNCNKYEGGAVRWITYSEYCSSPSHTTLVNHYNITKL